MAWLDDLQRLRGRVDNEGYGRKMAEVAERRALLEKFAADLAIEELLRQMNQVLLDDGANLVIDRSWQYDFEGDDDTDFEEDSDEILFTLYWHDGDPIELDVRVGIDAEDAGYVIVEDQEIDLDDDDDVANIQQALLSAFRGIAEIDT